MDRSQLIKELIADEGERLKPYQCTAGRTTIGIGRNLDDKGISHQEAIYMLSNDIDAVISQLIAAWLHLIGYCCQNRQSPCV